MRTSALNAENTRIDTRLSKITIFFFSFSLNYHLKKRCSGPSLSFTLYLQQPRKMRRCVICAKMTFLECPGFSKITYGIFFVLFFLFFSLFFPHLFAQKMQIVSHDFSITAILLSTITTTKILVVHPLSPATEDGENHDLGVSNDSGDMNFPKTFWRTAKRLCFAKIRP